MKIKYWEEPAKSNRETYREDPPLHAAIEEWLEDIRAGRAYANHARRNDVDTYAREVSLPGRVERYMFVWFEHPTDIGAAGVAIIMRAG